jgi:hypothetical protein
MSGAYMNAGHVDSSGRGYHIDFAFAASPAESVGFYSENYVSCPLTSNVKLCIDA